MQQAKVDDLQKILPLVDMLRLYDLLGLGNHYRLFVKKFRLIAKPLTILTSKDQIWTWDYEKQQAFETLKQKLGAASVLRRLDVSKSFMLYTD